MPKLKRVHGSFLATATASVCLFIFAQFVRIKPGSPPAVLVSLFYKKIRSVAPTHKVQHYGFSLCHQVLLLDFKHCCCSNKQWQLILEKNGHWLDRQHQLNTDKNRGSGRK